jgi:hypothetical protein
MRMSEKEQENGYRTYLLRLWREQVALPHCQPVWRCSLEETSTHNRRGFRSVEDLATHLRAVAGNPAGDAEPDTAGQA